MKIITVCGSVRFASEMLEYREQELKKGNWVLLPENMELDIQNIDKDVKEKMDILHFKKIELADEILIWNRNYYIGESTQREIHYASSCHKPISYLEGVFDWTTLYKKKVIY